jgi:hypothetical protein
MKIVCDIDGVICDEANEDVNLRKPYLDRIAYLNSLFKQGHDIIIYTSRGMNSCNDNPIEADKKYRELTTKQLNGWGVCFDKIYFGKPNADIYIDNHNMLMDDFFEKS